MILRKMLYRGTATGRSVMTPHRYQARSFWAVSSALMIMLSSRVTAFAPLSLQLQHRFYSNIPSPKGNRHRFTSNYSEPSRLFASASLPERAKLLPQVLRYRGKVDQGYGRGGKKLGVPTANLKASSFDQALQNVNTGVYFGWAALEDTDSIYKTVVNVGYSPTFEGQENKEKIIEAHLIVEDLVSKEDDSFLPDFYGTPLRLQLIGFLREEQKFDSFPELIAQIHADIADAKAALDCAPYAKCKKDAFFATEQWVGKGDGSGGGGDEQASWESQSMDAFLEAL